MRGISTGSWYVLLLLFVSLVCARAKAADLELHVSEGARVVLLPRTAPETIEIGLYNNRTSLREAVAAWRTSGLDHAQLVNRGGDTSFIVLSLSKTESVASLRRQGDRIYLSLRSGQPELHAIYEVYSVETLFEDPPRRPANWPDAALVPLSREGRTYGIDPREIRLSIGQEPRTPDEWASLFGPVAQPSWEDVARWRNLLGEIHDAPELVVLANWRLGMAHHTLGLPREALYYFERSTERGFPPASSFIGLADAALSIGRWDIARDACIQAYYRSAPEETVLVCFGLVSLATNHPPPADTGRALGAVTGNPTHQLLAGELLLRDGYTEEAAILLRKAARHTMNPRIAEIAWVSLGDAAMASGDFEMAKRAYNSAPHQSLDSVLRVRELALRMANDGVHRWPAWVPDLQQLASGRDAAAADALYLLAQVHERYADAAAVSEDLARLWDLDPITRKTDVPERLIAACQTRIAQLQREERFAELVQQFDVCWREDLDEYLDNVRFIEATSRAWEALGSRDRALSIQQQASTVLAAIGQEDAMVLARLAHLQTLDGRPELALETIAYAHRLPNAADARIALSLVSGDAHEALGSIEEALADWEDAATDPRLREEVALRSGMLQLRHDRCEQGVTRLSDRLEQAPIAGEPPGEIELLLARCEAKLGLPQDAIGHAALALSRAQDKWLVDEITWFASAVAARQGMVLPEDLRSDAPGFGAISAEDDAHARFTERLAAWKRGVAR